MTNNKLADALRKLLDYVDALTCRHEQTHRGGSTWTICDDCDMKWADSGGGFVPYSEPAIMAAARLALAEHDAPDKCFCDRMYPDSNPNASCGDCPTRDYAPQPAPAHVQVDVLSELADEIEEAYPNADASNLRAFAAAHPPAPAADGARDHVAMLCELRSAYDGFDGFSMEKAALDAAIAALRQPVPDAWTPSGIEYDRSIHSNPDAKAWADMFVETFPGLADKRDLMIGWFASAMMAMHDSQQESRNAD